MSKDHHADGQKDSASGTYNPPHDLLGETITILTGTREAGQAAIDANQQYNAGWNNAHSQKR